MRKLGIRYEGAEEGFEQTLRDVLDCGWDEFNAIEIGSAGCATLRAIYDIIKDVRGDLPFRVIGVDIPQGLQNEIKEIQKNYPSELIIQNLIEIGNAKLSITPNVTNLLISDGVTLLKNNWNLPIHFAHIDALHCFCHSTQDFLAIEPHVVKNGIVVFHDTCPISQGKDLQHDNLYIDVRRAITELGLLNNTRPGWELVREIQGTRTETNEWGGHGCSVFRKIK